MMAQFLSHYRLLESLGAGGNGEVFKAEDTRLSRLVAIKILHPDSDHPNRSAELLAEARLAAALNHPNAVSIYEINDSSEELFIVMEYIDGETLRQRLQRGPLECSEMLRIAIAVAEALSCAQDRGILHGDLTPRNIMLAANGRVKVLDFGLAQKTNQPFGSQDGTVSGTLAYMAPEKLRGEPVDGRADLFSLGVMCHEMLTGHLPFDGHDGADLIKAILHSEPPALARYRGDVPLAAESMIRRLLAKEPSSRYASAPELLVDLRGLEELLEKTEARAQSVPPPATASSPLAAASPKTATFLFGVRKAALPIAGLGALLLIVGLALQRFSPAFSPLLPAGLILASLGLVLRLAIKPTAGPILPISAPGAAFRGLLPFQEADRDHFYGRDAEAQALFEKLTHHDFRFGVLFGDSGCGKTSLLKAGVLPKLWEAGHLPIYCRSYRDPITALLDECRHRSQLGIRDEESPQAYLHRLCQTLNAELVVVYDQFEEFFIHFATASARDPFIALVADCHKDPRLPVTFLLSMRSDFLYHISAEFDGRIDEPLMTARLYHLRHFDERQAANIIEKSAWRSHLPFESTLIRKVARDLAVKDSVLPSELQIVGEQLQSKRIYNLQDYLRAGGKEALVHSFLEDVIAGSGEKESAQLLLRCLISEENTRLTLSVAEIARRMQRLPARVGKILRLFVQARLIREIQEEEPWRYELMHEYLIDLINHLTGNVMTATQRANRLLRQYLSSSLVDPSTRIPISKLWFVRRYADFDGGTRGRQLLRKSLRGGLAKVSGMTVLLALLAAVAAGLFSVREEWEETRLRDGHNAAVFRIAFSPDGRHLVSAGKDRRVMVWDFARRERLATLSDHRGAVNAVAFSPDGRWFVTGSSDSMVIVWDAARMIKARTLPRLRSGVNSFAFSPDGRLLACGLEKDGTTVWDLHRWRIARELPLSAPRRDLAFHPNGRWLIPAHAPAWDVTTGQAVGEWLGLNWGGNSVALSPDATFILSINHDGLVSFWDTRRRQLVAQHQAHRFFGRAIAFSSDGRLLATGAEDIVLWNATTNTILSRFEHTDNVWSLAFSPDGKWLVSAHGDGAILIWDMEARRRVADLSEHSDPVHAVAFSPDGRRLASAGKDQSIIIWDVEQMRKQAVLLGHQAQLVALSFSRDGQELISADMTATFIVWDMAKRQSKLIDNFSFEDGGVTTTDLPDLRWITTRYGIYESGTNRQVIDFKKALSANQALSAVAFSPDGHRVAIVAFDGTLVLWETDTWQILEVLPWHRKEINKARFSPDGRRLVVGDMEGRIWLFAGQPLREVGIVGRHSTYVEAFAFSPNGRELATASDDRTIALWDMGRRRLITRIGTHNAPVNAVAFSPDGKRLACGGSDKTVRIYARQRRLWGYRLE